MNDAIKHFNIRVYGLLISRNRLLVSHEFFRNRQLMKLPGGGVEFGEGIVDALKREFKEELNIQLSAFKLLHITENFIQSAFNKEDQLVSIYYKVESTEDIDSKKLEHNIEWIPIQKTNPDFKLKPGFTFPQDQNVFELLIF